MAENNFINGRLVGKTIDLLSHAMDYRSARHSIISGNLANVETPGYRPKDLSFDQELKRALEKDGVPIRKTDPRHFPRPAGGPAQGRGAHRIESREGEIGESNQLNIDQEMAKMVQNNLLYEANAKLLAKKFDALKLAIEGGRR